MLKPSFIKDEALLSVFLLVGTCGKPWQRESSKYNFVLSSSNRGLRRNCSLSIFLYCSLKNNLVLIFCFHFLFSTFARFVELSGTNPTFCLIVSCYLEMTSSFKQPESCLMCHRPPDVNNEWSGHEEVITSISSSLSHRRLSFKCVL